MSADEAAAGRQFEHNSPFSFPPSAAKNVLRAGGLQSYIVGRWGKQNLRQITPGGIELKIFCDDHHKQITKSQSYNVTNIT
ncbi:hypothetical protein SH589_00810 [Klebsiella aerogenes]|uniref:hypothetical protein n=1 Tax=Klebsiella aerogenes TaxID=548 RepID=UPI002E157E19|nr:hypothetical protein SH589_00810 [Klebsiella aerogenes]